MKVEVERDYFGKGSMEESSSGEGYMRDRVLHEVSSAFEHSRVFFIL